MKRIQRALAVAAISYVAVCLPFSPKDTSSDAYGAPCLHQTAACIAMNADNNQQTMTAMSYGLMAGCAGLALGLAWPGSKRRAEEKTPSQV
ncbi:MAG: hypothetical protein ACHQTE_00595 [Candidatus Saccharimonadales bacterium]